MADEIRVRANDPQAARAEIERTRARLSGTIDEIEDVLIRKRERVKRQLDVRARIREKPLHVAGIVLGLGFLIGALTGGGGNQKARLEESDERGSLWETRARRLLAIARSQEEEIDDLEHSLADLEDLLDAEAEYVREPGEEFEDGPSRWSALREAAAERIGDYLSAATGLAADLRRRI
jgi:ElaB/YqjD/DUF883 family membrane-anchored ribosome-binding protein